MTEIDEKKLNLFLNNIKSFYILRIVLSYLNKKQKLSLINYNKTLQKKFSINIIDYIKTSRKYKIIDENGNGKEYSLLDSYIFRFEENYLNGKTTDLKKEFEIFYFTDDTVVFEGKYINGKRNGKGKEYSFKDNEDKYLIFEGEYLNSKRHGQGKEFYPNGELRYEGEYLNGDR